MRVSGYTGNFVIFATRTIGTLRLAHCAPYMEVKVHVHAREPDNQ